MTKEGRKPKSEGCKKRTAITLSETDWVEAEAEVEEKDEDDEKAEKNLHWGETGIKR